ncbi:hypothetical protein FRC01_004497 [Tulasnella sp. 417]|nr:hypothetical protein FRC01_004497 [Tulasnella sp. 417]
MADNTRPGPLPPNEPGVHPSRPDPVRMARRFARRDPQLYPLAAAVIGVIGVGAWFALYKKPAELSRPDAVGGLPHSPELSKSRLEEWKRYAPQDSNQKSERDGNASQAPSQEASKR